MTKYKRLVEARKKEEAIAKARKRVLVDLPRQRACDAINNEIDSKPSPVRRNNNWPNRNTTNTVGIRAITKSKYTPVHGEK